MLGWSQEQLAEASNLTRQTIAAFENETRIPGPNNLLAIRVALEQGGVVFIEKNGGKLYRFNEITPEMAALDGGALHDQRM